MLFTKVVAKLDAKNESFQFNDGEYWYKHVCSCISIVNKMSSQDKVSTLKK